MSKPDFSREELQAIGRYMRESTIDTLQIGPSSFFMRPNWIIYGGIEELESKVAARTARRE